MNRSAEPEQYLTPDELARVRAAVTDAENGTTAELKVILTRSARGGIRREAERIFRWHQLHRTRERNAVLILLSTEDRECLIYGDEGIDRHSDVNWLEVRDAMVDHFRQDRMGDGLCAGVRLAGALLARHFPRSDGDKNEISDEVSIDRR